MWEGRYEERLILVDLIDRNAGLIGHPRCLLQSVVVAVRINRNTSLIFRLRYHHRPRAFVLSSLAHSFESTTNVT